MMKYYMFLILLIANLVSAQSDVYDKGGVGLSLNDSTLIAFMEEGVFQLEKDSLKLIYDNWNEIFYFYVKELNVMIGGKTIVDFDTKKILVSLENEGKKPFSFPIKYIYTPDDNGLIIAYSENLVIKIDEKFKIQKEFHLKDEYINDIFVHENNLWVATKSGVYLFDLIKMAKRKLTFLREDLDYNINSVCFWDKRQEIIVNSNNNVWLFSENKGRMKIELCIDDRIVDLKTTKDELLFIGEKNIYKYQDFTNFTITTIGLTGYNNIVDIENTDSISYILCANGSLLKRDLEEIFKVEKCGDEIHVADLINVKIEGKEVSRRTFKVTPGQAIKLVYNTDTIIADRFIVRDGGYRNEGEKIFDSKMSNGEADDIFIPMSNLITLYVSNEKKKKGISKWQYEFRYAN